MVLGLFPMSHYELRTTKLESGDLLALYSDGVTEACNPQGEEFGEQGLTEFLGERKSECCAGLVKTLAEHVRKWHGSPSFTDDFTIVLVRRN